jgi:hypothetical protein
MAAPTPNASEQRADGWQQDYAQRGRTIADLARDLKAERAENGRLRAAVEAVRDIHYRSQRPVDSGPDRGKHWCVGCYRDVDHHILYTPWPCPTYRAISAALSGDSTEESVPTGEDGEIAAERALPGGSMNPTPDCGGPRRPPAATEVWWCNEHREFHGLEGTDG